ncbi:restriction endonuclease subunit S [Serratia sp. TSA_198.1]|uniref:restriction endonuclease subunit S n=1 Tax=Serratia sp. TSA_198.1 TaxID=3415664 RepID=UPI00404644AE
MAKYKAYPEYKNSGVEWLGEMPCHWNLQKAKYIFRKVQRATTEQDGIVTAFRDGQVTLRSNRRVDGFTNALKEIGYQGVKAGDLLVHAMDGFAGAIGISDSDGKCSPVCSVCIPWDEKGTHMRYYGYLVRQLAVTDFILSLAKGIRERSTEFRFNEFSGLLLSLPPLTEQAQIAKFLDHETAKIDNLIEKQQQLIELLKEKRQAVISHAVTKGLNPDAPMKDSGVEWLGEVPEHWGLKQIRHLCSFVGGGTPSKSNPAFWIGSIPWVSPKDMKIDYIFDAEDHISESAVKQSSTKLIPVSSVLIVVRGMILSHSFPVAINTEIVTINQDMKALIPNVQISFEYLYLVLKGFRKNVLDLTDNSAHGTKCLKTESFERMQIPIPPLQEQLKIVFDIKALLSKIDSLVSRQNEALTLLQERRTALISAAVTGKIDVRNWDAPEAEKAEASQEATA